MESGLTLVVHNEFLSYLLLQTIQKLEPGMVALHCQEVGGKNYEDSMQHVNQFVK